MAGHATGQPMGGHALAGKWLRRPMGALLALAPNPIDTRALATRALATAPESAGIGDMQGKATPGLGALGRSIAAAGQNTAAAKEAAKEKAEEDAAYAEHDAEEAQTGRSAEDRRKREAAKAARAANHYWGGARDPRRALCRPWRGRGRLLYGGVRRYGPRALPQQGTVPGKSR